MLRIILSLLSTHQSSSSRTMMTISDIQTWHLGKLFGNGLDVIIVGDYPELMSEAIDRSYEIILRFGGSIALDEVVEHLIVGISKEHRFDVGIIYANMLHSVFLFISTCKLMLLNHAIHIVVDKSTYHQSILRFTIHGLCVDIILLLVILHEPSLVLELLEVLGSLLVHTRVVLAGAYREIDLRLDDVVQAHLVVASFSSCLFRVKNVVWARLDLFNKVFRWAYALKRFNGCHRFYLLRITYSPGI